MGARPGYPGLPFLVSRMGIVRLDCTFDQEGPEYRESTSLRDIRDIVSASRIPSTDAHLGRKIRTRRRRPEYSGWAFVQDF